MEIHGFMTYIDKSTIAPNRSLYYSNKTIVTKKATKDTDEVTSTTEEPITPEMAVKYAERLSDYIRASQRSIGAIKSTLSIENIERFKDKTTPNLL